MQTASRKQFISQWLPWLVIALLLLTTVVLWEPLMALMQAETAAQLQTEIERMGWLVPVAYFALSIIQIVGAPIPGYPVQLLGGALFGTFWGGVYAIIGMVAGGLLAAWLARTLGRPFVEKQVNPQTLDKYENLAKIDTLWVWVIILFIPLGDFPYYLAGLSRVKFRTLAAAILIARGPATFLITWAGEHSVAAPRWIYLVVIVVALSFVAAGYLLRRPLNAFVDRHILHRLQ